MRNGKKLIKSITKDLVEKNGEIKLVLESGKATIEILGKREENPIKLDIKPNGNFIINKNGTKKKLTNRPKFLKKLIRELKEEFGYNLDPKQFQQKNMLKTLLKLKNRVIGIKKPAQAKLVDSLPPPGGLKHIRQTSLFIIFN